MAWNSLGRIHPGEAAKHIHATQGALEALLNLQHAMYTTAKERMGEHLD